MLSAKAMRAMVYGVSPDDAVMVAQSFSKTYCMTGWRVGWIVVRRDAGEKAAQLNEFIVSHAASFTQRAAQTALAQGESGVKEMVGRLKENRDFCLRALSEIRGVSVPSPDGAFYLFPKIEGLKDSFDFCIRLLRETKVGIAPGVAFGAGGEGSSRLSGYSANVTGAGHVPLQPHPVKQLLVLR